MHAEVNVMAHADIYKLRWAPLLHDIQNALQVPPPGPFDHRSIEWSRSHRFQSGSHASDSTGDIAYIPWNRIEDFRKGEECRPDVECKFVRKDVVKQTTLSQPQPCSFIEKFRYGSASGARYYGCCCIIKQSITNPHTFVTRRSVKIQNQRTWKDCKAVNAPKHGAYFVRLQTSTNTTFVTCHVCNLPSLLTILLYHTCVTMLYTSIPFMQAHPMTFLICSFHVNKCNCKLLVTNSLCGYEDINVNMDHAMTQAMLLWSMKDWLRRKLSLTRKGSESLAERGTKDPEFQKK